MAISLASLKKGQDIRPPRMIIYGPKGIGKTTMASEALNPVFAFAEDGLGLLSPDRIHITSWPEVFEFIKALLVEEHSFRNFVIDSLDWLERLCHAHVRHVHGEKIFFDYGKGWTKAAEYFEELVRALDTLRDKKGMGIILIAHCKVKRVDAPDVTPYDKYMLDLHDKAAAVVEEWADLEVFMCQKVMTKSTDVGFGQKLVQGISTGEHVLYCEDRPAYSAKNRYNLPHELPLPRGESFATLRAAILRGIAASRPVPVPAIPTSGEAPVAA